MLKLVGSLCVASGGALAWYVQRAERRRERDTLSDLQRAFRRMGEEVRMARTPLPADRVLDALTLAADAAGAAGMAGGQMLDLEGEGKKLSEAELTELNAKKTGALLRMACESGAALAGTDAARRMALRRYGEELGIAFQITDDILDVTGDTATLGKTAGHDAEQAKATWPALLGLDEARARALTHCHAATEALNGSLFGSSRHADMLRWLALELADRTF